MALLRLDGLHHVTAITADAQTNLNFYGRLLGLRLVLQGVNADDPRMRHIAYGDERGTPGSIVTFLDMSGVARGRPGVGMFHRLLLRVADDDALDFWQGRLEGGAIPSERLSDRLLFSDPDGLEIGLVIDDGEDEPLRAAAAGIDRRFAICGIDSVHAYAAIDADAPTVADDVLEMESLGEGRWLARGERRHGLLIYDDAPSSRGMMGAGSMHHVAFTIRGSDVDAWRERLAASGLRPTQVLDRGICKSIYFRAQSGALLELATDGPGFVFEPPDHLGESLVLIGNPENRRKELERRFELLPNPRLVDVER
jgi:glyoxalase family protein